MTIASALVSLSLVYNIAAGGNKPRSEASSNSPSLGASISSQRLGAASSRPTTPTALVLHLRHFTFCCYMSCDHDAAAAAAQALDHAPLHVLIGKILHCL